MDTLGWIQDGEMVALGWTLLHFCWQGTAIALVYTLLDRAMVEAGAKLRYGIAVTALRLMPIAALMTFAEEQRLVVHVPGDGHEVIASRVGVMDAGLVREIPAAAVIVANSEMWIAQHAGYLLPCIDMLWLAGVVLLACVQQVDGGSSSACAVGHERRLRSRFRQASAVYPSGCTWAGRSRCASRMR